jgi:VWFA-related protein
MHKVGKLDTAKQAAGEFVEQMRVGDRVGLLAFNTEITYPQPISSNQEALLVAIESLEGVSDTAMYDALVEAVAILSTENGRKAVIVLTDGMDNRSSAGADAVLSGIDPSGLTIATVGLGDPAQQTATTAGIDESALRTLAERAGGDYAYANDRQQLTDLYSRYARALQSEYVITYTSPGGLHDGLTRNLTVSLTDAEDVTGQAAYNPGGLVPEVTNMVSWPTFLFVLSVLVILLLVPTIIQSGQALATRSMPRVTKKKSRIKLLD